MFTNWLHHHPGVEIIVRDRAGAYAEGGKQGAPDAIQVADRFHLSANAGAYMDEVLRSRRRHIEYVVVAQSAIDNGPTPTAPEQPPSQAQQELTWRRGRRGARWDEVRARRAAGYGIQRIAREMGMHRRTVRRYLATPGELVQLARVALQGQERPTRAVLVPRQPNVTPLQLRDERTELVDLQVDVGAQALFAELSRRLAHRGGRVVFVRWQERFYRVEDALRELRELGTDDITTMVVGRLADPSERREQALLTGWSVAEAFGAEGRDVLLIVDVRPAGLPELYSQRWIRWPVQADCCATVSSTGGMRALRGRCARSWRRVEESMAMDR